jgi:hydrogenase nickel incorporation protein HypA/HybF
MHEMGIAFELIDSLKKICEDNHVKKLKSVTLEVGEASMVVPQYMTDCWSAAIIDTPFVETKLKLKIIKCKGRCNQCGQTFLVAKYDRKCPKCGSENNFTPISGMGIEIAEVEAE